MKINRSAMSHSKCIRRCLPAVSVEVGWTKKTALPPCKAKAPAAAAAANAMVLAAAIEKLPTDT